VNGPEQVVFGWQCLLGALRVCRSPSIWGPWVALFGVQAIVVLAFWWGAHPLLSWCVAPVMRAIEGDASLRYPELFRHLPSLSRDAGLVSGALVLPVLAGVSTRLFERRFREVPPSPGAAWGEGVARAGSLLIAALPVTLAAIGLHLAVGALPNVRLSNLSRALAPAAADGLVLLVRIACAFSAALVVLGGRSGPRALAGIPSTWKAGLVPAAAAILLLVPVGLSASALVKASLAMVQRGEPEWVVGAVLARAAAGALLGMLASGAVTLAWLGAVEADAEGP
jgi:hypothetical protein